MSLKWLKKQLSFYSSIVDGKSNRLYAVPVGGLEIALIVIVVLIVGVVFFLIRKTSRPR